MGGDGWRRSDHQLGGIWWVNALVGCSSPQGQETQLLWILSRDPLLCKGPGQIRKFPSWLRTCPNPASAGVSTWSATRNPKVRRTPGLRCSVLDAPGPLDLAGSSSWKARIGGLPSRHASGQSPSRHHSSPDPEYRGHAACPSMEPRGGHIWPKKNLRIYLNGQPVAEAAGLAGSLTPTDLPLRWEPMPREAVVLSS